MLELKSKNLFTGKHPYRLFAVHKIFEFYDLEGKNICIFHNRGKLYNGLNNISTNSINLSKDLSSNLFRLDIVVVDFSFNDALTINLTNIITMHDVIREITNLPIIFISNQGPMQVYKESSRLKWFETAYFFDKNLSFSAQFQDSLDDYLVHDLKNDWKSNLRELKTQYIRDKNLRDLFGED
jgi:hypothetical protein